MPITVIDPTSALVVIDMQKGIVASKTVHPAKTIVENVVRLADAFREKKRKVVLVHVGWAGDGGDAVKTRNQSSWPQRQMTGDFFSISMSCGLIRRWIF
jgi:nicotinamidase-related amidase